MQGVRWSCMRRSAVTMSPTLMNTLSDTDCTAHVSAMPAGACRRGREGERERERGRGEREREERERERREGGREKWHKVMQEVPHLRERK